MAMAMARVQPRRVGQRVSKQGGQGAMRGVNGREKKKKRKKKEKKKP